MLLSSFLATSISTDTYGTKRMVKCQKILDYVLQSLFFFLGNLALKGESMRKAKQRNFVPVRTGFITVFIMVLTTVWYDITYKLPGSQYDTGFNLKNKIS